MSAKCAEYFRKFLECGAYCTPPGRTACALSSARTLLEWQEAESAGLVRLRCEPEEENYFDVYGKPDSEKERAMLEAALERDGCWCIVAETNNGTESTGDKWEIADSIGMCVYSNPLDPFQNCYVVDLMRNALDAVSACGEH